eukprot:1303220-Alexandrium_andersonii.AAC.1
MSASLVGSEMCIRDRSWPFRARSWQLRAHPGSFLAMFLHFRALSGALGHVPRTFGHFRALQCLKQHK